MKGKEFIQGLRNGFEEFAKLITNIINFILLLIAYFLGIGPTAILAKIRKKQFLDTKKEERESYWVKEEIKKEEKRRYYRQF